MMKKGLQILMILVFSVSFGQQTQDLKIGEKTSKETIYTTTEQAAEFPGGIMKFRREFSDKFDASAIKGKGKFSCELTFVILENGQISNIDAKGNDYAFNEEAKRTLNYMKDKLWKPGKVNGVPVKSTYRLPFNMVVE